MCTSLVGVPEGLFLISKTLIRSYINCGEFFTVNNTLREDNQKKEETENPENALEHTM